MSEDAASLFGGFSAAEAAAALAILVGAGLVKGVTGLGFSTSALPFLTLVIGLKAALPLVILPSLVSNVTLMARAGRFVETARRFSGLYIGAMLGVPLGLALLTQVDGPTAGGVLGLVLAAYVIFAFATPELSLPPVWERPLAPPVGFATGIVNGLTGSQVMPVTPYLMALRLDPDRFVQAINISFTLSSLVMLTGLSTLGLVAGPTLLLALASLPLVWGGVRLGDRLRRRLSPQLFRRAALLMLGAAAVALAGKALG